MSQALKMLGEALYSAHRSVKANLNRGVVGGPCVDILRTLPLHRALPKSYSKIVCVFDGSN